MRNFKVEKTVILAGLAALLLVDGALAYHNAKLSARDENPEQVLKGQAARLALLKADVERANRIKGGMPEVQKYFDQFETTLPPLGKGYSVLSQELDEIGHDTHVQTQDVRFHQKEVTGRNVDEVGIELGLVGDYAGIVRFLNHLQRSKNTYVVDSLGLDSETGANAQMPPGTVRVSLRLRSYFRKA